MLETRIPKRRRIVATLGPASSDETTLLQVMMAYTYFVLIDFSHGKHEELTELLACVRRLADELDVPIATLGGL